jgi:RHS repeat-associated protein
VQPRQKFTQKERYIETGLDYFGARYYASMQGRFTSFDPGSIKLKQLLNPQDLNRYAYVGNNPLRFIDPDGREKIELIFRTFIPSKQVQVPGTPLMAKGDGRKAGDPVPPGTFRTEIRVTIETDPTRNQGRAQVGDVKTDTGTSRMSLFGRTVEEGKASGSTLGATVSRQDAVGANARLIDVHVSGNEKFPLTPDATTPGIKFDFTMTINPNGIGAETGPGR